MGTKSFTQEQLTTANSVDLPALLDRHGITVKIGDRFRSPFREDRNPSFSIFRGADGIWRGHDFGDGRGYNAIKLVECYLGLGFVDAVKLLLAFQGSPAAASQSQTFHRNPSSGPLQSTTATKMEKTAESEDAVRFLSDPAAALDYLTRVRGIAAEVLGMLGLDVRLVEITHTSKKSGKEYKNKYVAFPTESGSFACRAIQESNPAVKRFVGPCDITILGDQNSNDVVVFESMTDLLSWVTMFCPSAMFGKDGRGLVKKWTLVSLNSTTNLQKLSRFEGKRLWLFLDNDPAGEKATAAVVEMFPGAVDCREDLQGQKDVNELLCSVVFAQEVA